MTRWEPYLWSPTPVATDEEVAAVEDAIGTALPADYLAIARHHQGESPEPGGVRVGGLPRTVECLLHFRPSGEHVSWNLARVDAELRDRLPPGVHPVAASTSGTFFGVDARGAVVHVDLDAEPDDEPDGAAADRSDDRSDDPAATDGTTATVREVAPDFPAFLARLADAADQP